MTINVARGREEDTFEFFTVRPNDFTCAHDAYDGYHTIGLDPKVVYRIYHGKGQKYIYVKDGKFTTCRFVNRYCGREYFPVTVDLGKREVRICDFKRIRDEGKFVGFDKATAMQRADKAAKDLGIPFIPLEEPTCSIL